MNEPKSCSQQLVLKLALLIYVSLLAVETF